MGQKSSPKSLRLGIVSDWNSTWFADEFYAKYVFEDFKVRNFVKDAFATAIVSSISIKRRADSLEVDVSVVRSGVVFGKGGLDIEILEEALSKEIGSPVKINVLEEKSPDLSARVLAVAISAQLERRVPFRRAMKMVVQRSLKSGALGVKVNCSGRLGGVEIARSEWCREGSVPLHTFRADIDYAFTEALTTYGKIGVKVWIYRGDVVYEKDRYQVPFSDRPAPNIKKGVGGAHRNKGRAR